MSDEPLTMDQQIKANGGTIPPMDYLPNRLRWDAGNEDDALWYLNDAAHQFEQLLALLAWHTDDEKCSFDHNGSCQTHCDFDIGPGDICHVEQSRRLLAAHARTEETPS